MNTIIFAGDVVASFVCDAGRRETSRTQGNGVTTTRTYRNDNLVESISTTGGAVAGFFYTYDANKRKTNVIDSTLPAWSQTFAYDAEDRLTNWNRTGGDAVAAPNNQDWTLSLVGDWESTTREGTVETRGHNAVHEITTTQPGTDPQVSLVHDDKGNLTTNPNRTVESYIWDFDNRMRIQ